MVFWFTHKIYEKYAIHMNYYGVWNSEAFRTMGLVTQANEYRSSCLSLGPI